MSLAVLLLAGLLSRLFSDSFFSTSEAQGKRLDIGVDVYIFGRRPVFNEISLSEAWSASDRRSSSRTQPDHC